MKVFEQSHNKISNEIDTINITPLTTIGMVKEYAVVNNYDPGTAVMIFNNGDKLSPVVWNTNEYDNVTFESHINLVTGGSLILVHNRNISNRNNRNNQNNTMRLDHLGKDEFHTIAMNLDYLSLMNLCRSNKAMQQLCNNNNLWEAKFYQDYPGYFRQKDLSAEDQYKIVLKWDEKIIFDDYLMGFHGSIEEGNFFNIDYEDETFLSKYNTMYPNGKNKNNLYDGYVYSKDYTQKVPYEYVNLIFFGVFQEVVHLLKSRPLPNFCPIKPLNNESHVSKIALVSPVGNGSSPYIIIDESTKILSSDVNSEWDYIQEIIRFKYRKLSNKELIIRRHGGFIYTERLLPEYNTPLPPDLWDMETIIYPDETPIWDEFYYEGFGVIPRADIIPSLDRYGDKYDNVCFIRIFN